MADDRISVFLLVQNTLLQQGIERLLRKEADIWIVGVSARHSAIHRQVINSDPDVLVVESGMLASQDLRSRMVVHKLEALKPVVIAMESDPISEACWRAIASAYIRGDAAAAKVIEAVRVAARSSVCRRKSGRRRVTGTQVCGSQSSMKTVYGGVKCKTQGCTNLIGIGRCGQTPLRVVKFPAVPLILSCTWCRTTHRYFNIDIVQFEDKLESSDTASTLVESSQELSGITFTTHSSSRTPC